MPAIYSYFYYAAPALVQIGCSSPFLKCKSSQPTNPLHWVFLPMFFTQRPIRHQNKISKRSRGGGNRKPVFLLTGPFPSHQNSITLWTNTISRVLCAKRISFFKQETYLRFIKGLPLPLSLCIPPHERWWKGRKNFSSFYGKGVCAGLKKLSPPWASARPQLKFLTGPCALCCAHSTTFPPPPLL